MVERLTEGLGPWQQWRRPSQVEIGTPWLSSPKVPMADVGGERGEGGGHL